MYIRSVNPERSWEFWNCEKKAEVRKDSKQDFRPCHPVPVMYITLAMKNNVLELDVDPKIPDIQSIIYTYK